MPDDFTPETTMTDDLDARIRQLVARAVADAPAPPDITRHEAAIEPTEPDHRRWWIGGGAAVAAAAAMIIGLVVVTSGDESTEPTTPATQPPVTTPSTAPPVRPPGVPAPTLRILTAGPNGVVEHRPGEGPHQILSERAAIALDVGDGSVLFQRRAGWTGGDGNWEATVPQVLSPNGTLTDLGGTADWDGAVTIHDVETVEGRTLLLYDLQVEDPSTGGIPVVYVIDIETLNRTEITRDAGTIISKADRLHLATSGMIVGQWSTSIATGIELFAVPRSPADRRLPTPQDLGLAEPFEECIDCPRSFAVTPDGTTFAWLEGEDTLHIRTLDGSYDETFALHDSMPNTIGASLDIGGTTLVITPEPLNSDSPPLAIDLADPTSEPQALEGRWATLGPAAMLPELTLPPSTTTPPSSVPSTSTPGPPASGVIDDVVTAGPGGVVAYQDGEPLTITAEPMEMALATGDGTYVVQRRAGYEEPEGYTAADTVPLVLSSDGALSPLWRDAEPAWYELQDVEVVEGRRLLVYTADPDVPVENDSIQDEYETVIYSIDLDDPEASPVELDRFTGFEGGVSRLHLATTGLIVGEFSESVVHQLLVLAVPTSPASESPLPTPASLGLEESYGDCSDCPTTFTVSPHGTVFAWLDRTAGIDGHTELVVQPADGGEPQRFDPFPEGVNTTLIGDLDYLAEGGQLLSYWDPEGGQPGQPVHIAATGTATELTGIVATADPTGS